MEQKATYIARNRHKFHRNAAPPEATYGTEFGHWFRLVLYVADSPAEHEAIRRMPLLIILSYADDKAQREQRERELIEAAFKAGVPFAGFLGRRK